MCRPEKPITTRNRALRELAEWLRDQRERTRQGYRALSVRAGFHATTLQRAASGEGVPKLQTVLSYARACDASPEEARRLWKRARYEETRRTRGGRGLPSPRPEFIRDFVDISAALHDLYEKAGSPALRTMEQRAGNFGVLPRSTVHRIVTKQAMPHNKQQFQAYLRACEVPETEWPDWEGAWTRAWRHEKQDDFAARGTAPTPLRDVLAAAEIAAKDVVVQTNMERTYTTMQQLRERANQESSVRVNISSTGEISATRNGMPLRDGEVLMTRNGVALRDGDVLMPRHGVPVSPPQVKHRQPARRPQRRPASRHAPEHPAQGQLAFALPESPREPDALF
ncbi:helix-turn-helix domain-containing protein [Streptomyces acidiscabies]|uniref:Helix-turn-helix transcriptional regulator n=1 Tax=Streptomyces acidiscabies TaxID=42234 RepID=A0ABU4MDS0_9ACTN|nr:helix-turn-helix transcriptional regulator [Streptomyces acidiscabies]MDX3025394.1 helix-turn-helix transcriptional regulator [Streptomyces acidiscabies]